MASPPTLPTLLHYRPWRGELSGSARLVWPIARVSLRMIFRRKLFWAIYALSLTLFLMFFFGQYLLAWAESQTAENSVRIMGANVKTRQFIEVLQKALKLNGSAETYRNFIAMQASVVMIVLALAGSILVGNDFRFGSMPFFLSKPVSRWHYLIGKGIAVGVFVNLLTTLPALALFVQFAMLEESWAYFRGDGILLELGSVAWRLPISPVLLGIVAYGLELTVCLSLLLLATASWLRKTVPMIMAWTTLFIFVPRLTRALVVGLHYNARWRLLDLWNDLFIVGSYSLGLGDDLASNVTQPAVVEASLVLGAVCILCLIYLNQRIRAVEVVH
jgi:ABC-type transport system involved in multi-copper enzyme maturation permease subunit